jgi:endonuclease YncB( thermonuclease family)
MLSFLCAFVALACLPLPGVAATLTGRVVGVHDGDTITVIDATMTQHKIRLAGIDAPELKQEFGARSKQNLSNIAFDKDALR